MNVRTIAGVILETGWALGVSCLAAFPAAPEPTNRHTSVRVPGITSLSGCRSGRFGSAIERLASWPWWRGLSDFHPFTPIVPRALGQLHDDLGSELGITSVFSCVARWFKARASFMFAGCCWRRSLALDGGPGTRRGHNLQRPLPYQVFSVLLPTCAKPGCGAWAVVREWPLRPSMDHLVGHGASTLLVALVLVVSCIGANAHSVPGGSSSRRRPPSG